MPIESHLDGLEVGEDWVDTGGLHEIGQVGSYKEHVADYRSIIYSNVIGSIFCGIWD